LGRLKYYRDYANKATGKTIPIYDCERFSIKIRETKPDTVIVTTVDRFHHITLSGAKELAAMFINRKTNDNYCRKMPADYRC
jgi:hypothetical protein